MLLVFNFTPFVRSEVKSYSGIAIAFMYICKDSTIKSFFFFEKILFCYCSQKFNLHIFILFLIAGGGSDSSEEASWPQPRNCAEQESDDVSQ